MQLSRRQHMWQPLWPLERECCQCLFYHGLNMDTHAAIASDNDTVRKSRFGQPPTPLSQCSTSYMEATVNMPSLIVGEQTLVEK